MKLSSSVNLSLDCFTQARGRLRKLAVAKYTEAVPGSEGSGLELWRMCEAALCACSALPWAPAFDPAGKQDTGRGVIWSDPALTLCIFPHKICTTGNWYKELSL